MVRNSIGNTLASIFWSKGRFHCFLVLAEKNLYTPLLYFKCLRIQVRLTHSFNINEKKSSTQEVLNRSSHKECECQNFLFNEYFVYILIHDFFPFAFWWSPILAQMSSSWRIISYRPLINTWQPSSLFSGLVKEDSRIWKCKDDFKKSLSKGTDILRTSSGC